MTTTETINEPDYFQKLSIEQLLTLKVSYEKLLDEKDTPTRFLQMIAPWQRGLAKVLNELERRNNI